jgi:RNAse (barnase) inhibitor barstar
MNIKTIIINGNNFSDLETFFAEVEKLFTRDPGWKAGHSLDAFNELLRGGFGVHKYQESIRLAWTNFSNSRKNLGQELINKLVRIITHHDHIEFMTTG